MNEIARLQEEFAREDAARQAERERLLAEAAKREEEAKRRQKKLPSPNAALEVIAGAVANQEDARVTYADADGTRATLERKLHSEKVSTELTTEYRQWFDGEGFDCSLFTAAKDAFTETLRQNLGLHADNKVFNGISFYRWVRALSSMESRTGRMRQSAVETLGPVLRQLKQRERRRNSKKSH